MIEFNQILLIISLIFLCVLAVATIATRNLIKATIFLSIFSLLMALCYLLMNAPDVAITEASIGAGISTLVFLAALCHVKRVEKFQKLRTWPFSLVVILFMFLVFSSASFPFFGDINAITHQTIAKYYIQQTPEQIGANNLVTAILASFRGFDTLGELVVIFTASIGIYSMFCEDAQD